MEMPISITFTKIAVRVIPAQHRTDNILAFAQLDFYQNDQDEDPVQKVRGITIRKQESKTTGQSFTKVVFPGYKAGSSYITSFIIENKNIYSQVIKLILEEFSNKVGDGTDDDTQTVDPYDIPI